MGNKKSEDWSKLVKGGGHIDPKISSEKRGRRAKEEIRLTKKKD